MYFRATYQKPFNVLNVWLDPGASGLSIVFELCSGNQLIGSLKAQALDFGLDTVDTMARGPWWWGPVHQQLIDLLQTNLPTDATPLWLSFGTHFDPSSSQRPSLRSGATVSRPSGYLAVLSWELNLVPKLNRPVLRMQGLPVRPLTQHQTLHIAICCSFSAAKQAEPPNETLLRVFSQIPIFPGQDVTFHVFADLQLQPLLVQLPALLAPAKVQIYDPHDAAKYGDAAPSQMVQDDGNDLENPWLLWMRDSLLPVGADAVQFVTHGYMSRGNGALAFAESPVHNQDRAWARFVGTRQISTLLDRLGAWSAVLTSPLVNYSAEGLRVLHEDLTDYVAGPLLLYEMWDDPERKDLRAAYSYLFGQSPREIPLTPSIALYTHPDWTQPFDVDPSLPLRHMIQEYTLAARLHTSFAGPKEVPAWVAAGQRSLEKSVAKMSLADTETGESQAAQEGRQEALRFTADLFAKYAGEDERATALPVAEIPKETV
jgi:hypothetical protein